MPRLFTTTDPRPIRHRSTLSRRTFLTGLAAVPVIATVGCSPRTTAGAAPDTLRPLPIPPLAPSTVDATGTRRFTLTAASGTTEMIPGKRTPTWGFNGSILGPTIRARRGEKVGFTITNRLPEPTTVHWHGMHVPARHDGGPHQTIAPGGTWKPEWTVNQPGATLWYHPHPHGSTEKHAYRGLAGMFLVDDDQTTTAALPHDYGVDDIPLIVQDRRFTASGALDESSPSDIGLLGDTIITNGIAGTYFDVAGPRVRLRILNGSGGRMYNFGLADGSAFSMIASDGGLLPRPVSLTRLALSPGERAEIVVSVGQSPVRLRAFPFDDPQGIGNDDAAQFGLDDSFDILELRPAETRTPAPALPTSLATISQLNPATAAVRRRFDLQWYMINRQRMDMNRIDHTSRVDTTELWTVRNRDNWPHNFHVHDTQFQIVDVDGRRPPAHLSGWKDTVYVPPGSTIRLILRFSDYTDPTFPYMYHCHLMLHEDQGMMGQFLVLAPGQRPAPMTMPMSGPDAMPGMDHGSGSGH
ncbi:multicopper oxidase family protein [Gordonia neofelifaecis]|uniref:Multicopper oxidase CueO n=1 Tax=Gordonia neofelifaecis NRRL B-59395 TaxID=644548 RepID=F1YDZ1_9ACTN|nr:multicopper oxidase domain-containing protein [Gordonia neofelifaecis]EGD57081.1 multicopper oxidase [Gordonia neofelifaecis NRRL B-59395]